MKITMTNAEAVLMFNTLSGLQVQAGPKFRYGVAKNKAILKDHVESIQEASQFPEDEDVKAFNEKRDDLLKEFSVDKEGNPNMVENPQTGQLRRAVPPENQGAYTLAVEVLQEEYKEITEKMEAHGKMVNELISEKNEFDMRLIRAADLPDDPKFPQSAFNVMLPLFEDPEKEKGAPSKK